MTTWLLGAQTAESAQAGVPPADRLQCGDFWQSGYYCLGRICHRNPDGQVCHARTTECNNWPGANGQCWNWNGIRYCDWWVYPRGNQRRCVCSQAWR